MNIVFVKGDLGGCGFYRCDEPARVLRQLGHTVDVMTELPIDAVMQRGELRVSAITVDADVIVMQRPVNRLITYVFKFAAEHGIPMLVDIDDDLERINPANVASQALDPRRNPDMNWTWLRKCCDLAAGVIVSTPALQRYAPGRSTVVRNGIPAWVCDLPNTPNSRLTFGWTGTLATHPHDFHVMSGVLQQVLDDTNGCMHVIGEIKDVRETLGLRENPGHTEWTATVEGYLQSLNEMDIGVVPLEQSTFNNAKSALKSLELAAAGVPCVASPTPEYKLLEQDGGCVTATRPRHWIRELRLLADPGTRAERAVRSREVVRQRHTTEVRAELWEQALKMYIN